MEEPPILRAEDVRRIAALGRVRPPEGYHTHLHGVRWRSVLVALATCYRVVRDARRGRDGAPLHPDGHVSWGGDGTGAVLRVDFDLFRRPGEEWILVVTALEVRR